MPRRPFLVALSLGGLLAACATTPPPSTTPDDPRFAELPPPPLAPTVSSGAVLEVLEDRYVMEVVLADKANVKRCADLHRELDGRHGKVLLTWKIDLRGAVSDVEIISPEWRTSIFSECVASRARQWRFPPHRSAWELPPFPFAF